MEDNTWFGVVRWCNEDIAQKLAEAGIEPTADNVEAVRCECENGHQFIDNMIASGWEFIEYIIFDKFIINQEDTFDYEAAGLFSPEDCDENNPPRTCFGCKFEQECYS
jgi:hypothetical protein